MKLTFVNQIFRGVIMGPPGSGKGTISKRIISCYNLQHLSSGDLLRKEINLQSSLGIAAEDFIKSGKLVPDEIMQKLILSQINSIPKSNNWLLDGFPRTLPQAEYLLKYQQVNHVINLDVPFDTICDRLSSRWTHVASGRVYNSHFNPPKQEGVDDVTGEILVQREDDKAETVLKRLKQYQEQTLPLLEYFQQKGICVSYSGTKTDEIWPQVQGFLDTVLDRQ